MELNKFKPGVKQKTFYVTEDPDFIEEIYDWICKNADYEIEKGESLKIDIRLNTIKE